MDLLALENNVMMGISYHEMGVAIRVNLKQIIVVVYNCMYPQ